MVNKFLLFVIILLIPSICYCQIYTQWQDCIGGIGSDHGESVIQINSNHYIIAGMTNSIDGDFNENNGDSDAFVAMLDSSRNIVWQNCYGGSNSETIRKIIQTNDGGFACFGYTESNDFDVSGNHGELDFWLIKINSNGNLEWQKCYGGSDNEHSYSIIQTNDNGYLLVGDTYSYDGDAIDNNGFQDCFLVKTDSMGNIEWNHCYGGTDGDKACAVIQTYDNGYLISGGSSSNDIDVSGNHGGSDLWVFKIDSVGNLNWQKCYGGSEGDGAYDMQQINNNEIVIAGVTNSNDGDVTGHHGLSDYWIISIDTIGCLNWQKCYGGSHPDGLLSFYYTSNKEFILAGGSYSSDGDINSHIGSLDCWIVKLDSVGNLIWEKSFGGTGIEQAISISQTADESAVFIGATESNDVDISGNHGSYDILLAKLGNINQVDEIKNNSLINLFPNPANHNIQISHNELVKKVEIYNMVGELKSSINSNNMSISLNIGSYANGVYLIKIITSNNIYKSKFIKE
ncbi:MAG: T9SS type A sorting domain-containing protein [Bacteroidota bacterium]